ncbi:molybdenum cofactor guanylyltransferase [Allohahella marinimesophila]|uniref:Molybdenum cofactor guanylyltransferase n=1 Tax=Allohahella marinimesophila TaxID=1054972 RepID=A0ABP7QBK3_9GAMM
MSFPDQRIDTIILAGGRGDRMGGQDKGWVDFGTSTFIEATLAAFADTPVRPLISVNRNLERYRALALQHDGLVIQDLEPDFRGPLGGLVAAVSELQSDWVFVVPCDTPLLSPLFARRLLAAAQDKPSADGFVASDGQRIQPLHCLLKRSALQQLPAFMAVPRERPPGMMGWTSQCDVREVDFSDSGAMFANINTPQMLDKVRAAGRRFQD